MTTNDQSHISQFRSHLYYIFLMHRFSEINYEKNIFTKKIFVRLFLSWHWSSYYHREWNLKKKNHNHWTLTLSRMDRFVNEYPRSSVSPWKRTLTRPRLSAEKERKKVQEARNVSRKPTSTVASVHREEEREQWREGRINREKSEKESGRERKEWEEEGRGGTRRRGVNDASVPTDCDSFA